MEETTATLALCQQSQTSEIWKLVFRSFASLKSPRAAVARKRLPQFFLEEDDEEGKETTLYIENTKAFHSLPIHWTLLIYRLLI